MEDKAELEAVPEAVVHEDGGGYGSPSIEAVGFLPLVAKAADLPPVPFVIPK